MADEQTLDAQQHELLFMQLVMMFQGMAMQQLGKVANPVSQRVELDLGQAKNFIDLLSMIENKTSGNLNDNEKRLLEHALFELRMNYVDEINKGDAAGEPDSAQDGQGAGEENDPTSAAEETGGEAGGEPSDSDVDDEGKSA